MYQKSKFFILSIFGMMIFISSYAQHSDTLKISSQTKIAEGVSLFTTDIFENVLYVNNKNELIKIDKKGMLVGVYSRRINGDLAVIDATNALKIIAYYPDFLNLTILDNFLSPLSEVSFRAFDNAGGLKLICSSTENGFWIYDELSRSIKNVNENLDLSRSSGDLYQLLSYLPNPTKIISYKNQQYLYDKKHGIYFFDEFGAYVKTIPIVGASDFQIKENEILFTRENELLSYNPMSLKTTTIHTFQLNDLKSIRRENNSLYVLAGKELFLYSIDHK